MSTGELNTSGKPVMDKHRIFGGAGVGGGGGGGRE